MFWRNKRREDPPDSVSIFGSLGFRLLKPGLVASNRYPYPKCILNLPYLCSETYRERLVSLGLLPLSYWHEYLHLVFFFKAVNGLVDVFHDVFPEVISKKPERPDPPVATKFPFVRPNAKPLPTNAPSSFVQLELVVFNSLLSMYCVCVCYYNCVYYCKKGPQ